MSFLCFLAQLSPPATYSLSCQKVFIICKIPVERGGGGLYHPRIGINNMWAAPCICSGGQVAVWGLATQLWAFSCQSDPTPNSFTKLQQTQSNCFRMNAQKWERRQFWSFTKVFHVKSEISDESYDELWIRVEIMVEWKFWATFLLVEVSWGGKCFGGRTAPGPSWLLTLPLSTEFFWGGGRRTWVMGGWEE